MKAVATVIQRMWRDALRRHVLVVKVADGPCEESDQQQRVVAVVGQAWENELVWTNMNARRRRNSRNVI